VLLVKHEPPPFPVHLVLPSARSRTAKERAFVSVAASLLRRALLQAAAQIQGGRPDAQYAHQPAEPRVAKAPYVRTRGFWRVFWQRRNLKWHSYETKPERPSRGVFRNWCHYCTSGPARFRCFLGNRVSTVAPARRRIGSTRTRGSSSYASEPGYKTMSCSSFRSASADRIDEVRVGASARLISIPNRRPFLNNNRSSSAP
jgi:hypothetical protein